MGLADVQLIRWAVPGVAAVKSVDVLLRGEPVLLAALWAFACVSAVVWPRRGAAAVAAVAFGSSLLFEPSNHTTLFGVVAAAVWLFDGDDLRQVLRIQAVVVYLFASVHKVAGGRFLTGASIAYQTWWDAAPVQAMAIGALAAQLFLVWAIVRREWVGVPVAVALHVGIVVGMSTTIAQVLRLSAFNGLMVLLVAAAVRPRRSGP